MLAMTQEAADAVERIVSQPAAPPGALLRIAAAEGRSNGPSAVRQLELELVEGPQSSDLVVQEMHISVEPRSLPYLDDKVLDAQVVEDGIQFVLYPQSDADKN